jgi:hypothetical protein
MAVIGQPPHTTIRDSYAPGTLGLSRNLRPSLHGALVVVATVAMAITAAVEKATREVTLPRWGDAMVVCDGDKAS